MKTTHPHTMPSQTNRFGFAEQSVSTTMMRTRGSVRRLVIIFAGLVSLGQSLDAAPTLRSVDRARLPAALQNIRLENLSTGALLRLDLEGDLVEASAAWSARAKAMLSARAEVALVSLDPRVASNIRLGDDPDTLPQDLRAQAEPYVVRSPTDPDFLLATFQEGRRTDGGAANCGYSVSHDGGLSWTRALIPNVAPSSGGPYSRATDPVSAIAFDGTAYLNLLAATNPQFTTGALLVSRSLDGGNTFAPPVVVYQSPNTLAFPDKNWMTVNTFPGTPRLGRLVVTFTLFTGTNSNGGAIKRSFSDDRGATWSPIADISPAADDAQGSQPVFLASGRLAVVYWNFNHTATFSDDFLQLVLSQDGGVTFGPPRFITNVSQYAETQIRSGGFLPSVVADHMGNLCVVYQGLLGGAPKILFTKSSDEGATWTSPTKISDNPDNSGVFNPAIAASPDGQILTVAFYDHRDHPGSGTLVDMYLAQSFDGGANWQPNLRLTSVSTDAALAPLTGSGYMLGDYLGVAESTNPNVPAVPVWIDTRAGNPDPFVARVGIAPSFNFTSWLAGHLSLGQILSPALGGEAGDADGDGEDNLSEFRTQTDPNDPTSVIHTARQLNISTRARVEAGDENVLIGGFIITGTDPKRVIIRAIGPSLTARGVPGALQNPTLELVPENGPRVFNDDWRDSDAAAIQGTTVPPGDDRESAIVRTLAPGNYTAIVRGKDNTTGVALVELYDLDPSANSQLANISSRSFVNTDDNVMIGGLIVGHGQGANGAGSVRVVVRGIGPSLTARGIAGALQDPELILFNSNGDRLASNDNWQDSQAAEIQATGLAPTESREAAVLLTLPAGNYTALVRGKDRSTGVAVIESFNVR